MANSRRQIYKRAAWVVVAIVVAMAAALLWLVNMRPTLDGAVGALSGG